MYLTKEQARRFLLAHQGLLSPRVAQGKAGILEFIRKAGCLQYDPLNKVGRNADLVLQSRIQDYRPTMLEELLYRDRKLVDGWDKNMSIYPVEDWPYFSRYRQRAKERYGSNRPVTKVLPAVREVISEKGPVSSGDLQLDEVVNWSWGPTRIARAALESMFRWGELIVHHKVGTRRFYDFAHEHLDSSILGAPEPNPTLEDFFQWLVKRRTRAIGLLWDRTGDAWLGISGMKAKDRTNAVANLLQREEIIQVEVEDIRYPCYICVDDLALLTRITAGAEGKPRVSFLAPLDNLLWDRRLINEVFGFAYTWEVYKPKAQRDYGYYVLPVLYGTKFVGRFEPVLDRQARKLVIQNWWWEPGVRLTRPLERAVQAAIKDFTAYLGVDDIEVTEDTDWLAT